MEPYDVIINQPVVIDNVSNISKYLSLQIILRSLNQCVKFNSTIMSAPKQRSKFFSFSLKL